MNAKEARAAAMAVNMEFKPNVWEVFDSWQRKAEIIIERMAKSGQFYAELDDVQLWWDDNETNPGLQQMWRQWNNAYTQLIKDWAAKNKFSLALYVKRDNATGQRTNVLGIGVSWLDLEPVNCTEL